MKSNQFLPDLRQKIEHNLRGFLFKLNKKLQQIFEKINL